MWNIVIFQHFLREEVFVLIAVQSSRMNCGNDHTDEIFDCLDDGTKPTYSTGAA